MAASAGDKTEKATPQRLREARRRGETPTSPDFAGGALALIMLVVLQQQGGHIFGGLLALLTADLAAAANPGVISEATIGRGCARICWPASRSSSPLPAPLWWELS